MRRFLYRWAVQGAAPYLVGLVVGLLLCSLAGRYFAATDKLGDYPRLHSAVSAAVNYMPSVSQLRNMIRSKARPDQILVLISGSSVIYGTGQGVLDLWSVHLQEMLGDHYVVVNLAQPSGYFTGYGTTMLAVMAREYPKIILVSDGRPPTSPDAGVPPHKHLFWDAYYKGLISDQIVQDRPELFRELDRDRSSYSLERQGKFDNVQHGMLFDSLFYFNELWGAIRLHYVNFIYNMNLAGMEMAPLCTHPDYQHQPFVPRETALPPKGSPTFNGYFGMVKGNARPLDPHDYEQLDENLGHYVFSSFAEKTVLVHVSHARHFLNYLSPEELKSYYDRMDAYQAIYLKHGFHCVVLQDFVEDDNDDVVHLTPKGGDKMAKAVLVEVQKIAKRFYGE